MQYVEDLLQLCAGFSLLHKSIPLVKKSLLIMERNWINIGRNSGLVMAARFSSVRCCEGGMGNLTAKY